MHAVILAGGQGTRLRPLTYARRKELLPLLNRPLLEYRLRNLAEHGVTDVAMACSQGAGEIEDHFGDGASLGLRMTYHYEDRPLGSGRAVKEAAQAAGAVGRRIVVCNGDILTNIDLRGMMAQHASVGAALSISLAPVDDPWHFGVVAIDRDLRIEHFVEKPPQGEEPSNLINAGTWIWEPEVLARIPDDDTAVRDGFSERVLFPGVIAAGMRVQGFVEDLWVDVGSPERYLRATRLLLARAGAPNERELLLVGDGVKIEDGAVTTGRVLIGDGAVIERGVMIAGPSVIGPRVRIGRNATIDASVLWDDAEVSANATIGHSIIGGGARIGEGARLLDAVLADRTIVANGCSPHAGLRLEPDATYAVLAPRA